MECENGRVAAFRYPEWARARYGVSREKSWIEHPPISLYPTSHIAGTQDQCLAQRVEAVTARHDRVLALFVADTDPAVGPKHDRAER